MKRLIIATLLLFFSQAQATYIPNAITRGTWVDHSGNILFAGVSQLGVTLNPLRAAVIIQNPCFVAYSLYFNWTSAASTAGGSLELSPCGDYDSSADLFMSIETINLVAQDAMHPYILKEGIPL